MADGTNHKVPKTVEKHKIPNMINRTTSECLRVGDSDKILSHPSSLMASTTPPKKKPSFQITSVTVGPHMSNDGGDDSADDLDESHTEDISDVIDNSRVTDIETPSYSEDTFSKDDVFFNSSTSLGSAPVIPTSSQYGLAIVSTPDGCGPILNTSLNNNLSGNELHVSVTDSVINLGLVGNKHIDGDMREIHSHPGRNERFKVVKIESTEPFKRGRWMCMDYLDHTMTQHQNNPMNTARLQESVGSNEVPAVNQGTGTDSGISVSEHQTFTNVQEDQAVVRDPNVVKVMNNRMDQQSLSSHSTVSMSSVQTSISPGQTMQFSSQSIQQINSGQPQLIQQAQSLTSVPQGQPNLINTNLHQSQQQHQMQQIIGNSNLISQQPTSVQNQIPHQQMNQPHQPMSQSHQQISQHQTLNQPHQPMSQPHQPMSQPLQQMQPGVHIQQVPMQQQNINTSNIQQFQQQPQNMHQQMQQTSHSQNIQQSSHQQNLQQPSHPQNMQQPILHQQHIQQTMQQPIPQAIQHQHTMTIPMQQTVNQVSVPQQVMHQQPMQQQTMQQQPPMQQQPQQMQQQPQQMQQQPQQMQQQPQQMQQQPQQMQQQPQQMQQQPQQMQQQPQQMQQQPQQLQQQPQQMQQQPIQPQAMQSHQQPMQQQQTMQQQPQSIQQQQQPIQQMSVQASSQLHNMQQSQTQHMQHTSLQQHSVPGVSCPQLQQPTSQVNPSQQVYHTSSQPIIQPVMGSQPNLIPQQQQQYFTNTQTMQGQIVSSPPMHIANTLQTQPLQVSVNMPLQQSYPITSIPQHQQMQMVHPVPPTNIQHVPSSQINPMVQMTAVPTMSVGSNLQIPSSQCNVISPQATNQGPSLVQNQCFVSQSGPQPIVSSQPVVVPTHVISGSQTLPSSVVNNIVPSSVVDNTSAFPNETIPHEQITHSTTVQENLVEPGASAEEVQPAEDPESSSGTNAVAIDNKIEQAMDLVKSHLMFAVREEVEVLKEKIAELMERINQLELENSFLKSNATQETLAQLSSSVQQSLNNAP